MTEFKNESGKEFTDISSEQWREYTFPGGEIVRISAPQQLSVSDSGHRLFDESGTSHYIPSGWIHLRCMTRRARLSVCESGWRIATLRASCFIIPMGAWQKSRSAISG